MADERAVLGASVDRLRELVEPLSPEQRRQPAYPSEWSVAQVLSHLGSGAVIAGHRVDQALGGPEIDAQPIWEEWNAKDPDAMVADGLAADAAFLDRLDALSIDERASFVVPLGPMELDYDAYIGFRVNEHILHTWDVEVVFYPAAVLPAGARTIVLRVVPTIAGFAGKATGSIRTLEVATTGPDDRYSVQLTPDGVVVTPSEAHGPADLVLPAEALVRLVYGRLDPDHTPSFKGDDADLDELRRAFPGV